MLITLLGHVTRAQGGGGALTYKSDRVHLPTHQIKGLLLFIFLQKRGSMGDKSEKGGSLGVKVDKNAGNFNISSKFSLQFANCF